MLDSILFLGGLVEAKNLLICWSESLLSFYAGKTLSLIYVWNWDLALFSEHLMLKMEFSMF